MKHIALESTHVELGARMAEFAGYNMPIEYTGIKDEHLCVRNKVGVFDVSHMGEIWITGDNTLRFIQKVFSNDASKLPVGKAQYGYFPNAKGGIVDDVILYRYSEGKYFFVVNASNIDKDYNWLLENQIDEVVIENSSENIGQLAVQGPKAIELIKKITNVDVNALKSFEFAQGKVADIDEVIVSKTGYTGEDGVELYFYKEHSLALWNTIMEAGNEFEIQPIGLGARDTLRLEKGYCLYGHEINDSTSAIAANLGWVTKFDNKEELIDKNFLQSEKKNGVSSKLVAFKMIDRGIPRHKYVLCDKEGNQIGVVTSGSISPFTGESIGMGYVKTEYSKIGMSIYVQVRKKILKAEVVKLPFV